MTTVISSILIAIITSLFTLIIALLSGYIGWHLHMRLRIEKLKEILYKERLALYKKISDMLWPLNFDAKACIYKCGDHQKVRTEALNFLHFIERNRLFIPEPLYKKCLDFFKFCVIKALIENGEIEEKVSIINEIYGFISNTMRKELGIDILSKDIELQLETIIKEWKNETDTKTDNCNQKPER